MRPFDREPHRDSFGTWLWIVALGLIVVLFVTAAMAHAGTVTVAFREQDADLVRCRITLQNAQGGAIASQEVDAFNNDQIHEVVFQYETRLLQGTEGRVVGWCVDLAGQTSVESVASPAIFPDVAPAPPAILGVQVVP